jgi:hypothetical protein
MREQNHQVQEQTWADSLAPGRAPGRQHTYPGPGLRTPRRVACRLVEVSRCGAVAAPPRGGMGMGTSTPRPSLRPGWRYTQSGTEPGTQSASDLGAQPVAEDCGDFAGIGVAAQGGLGEHQITVNDDLKPALRRRDQLDRLDDGRPPLQQLVRQTDGSRDIVSGDAELDRDPVAGINHDSRLPHG